MKQQQQQWLYCPGKLMGQVLNTVSPVDQHLEVSVLILLDVHKPIYDRPNLQMNIYMLTFKVNWYTFILTL